MRTIITLIENNIRITILKKPKRFILNTLAPVIILLLASKLLSYGQGYINLGIVNEDNSKTSNVIVEMVNKTEGITIKNLKASEVQNKFAQKDIDMALIIPKDYEKSIINNKNKEIEIKVPQNTNLYTTIKASLEVEIQNLKDLALVSNGDNVKYNHLIDSYKNNGIKIEKTSLNDLKSDHEYYRLFIGFLVMFIFFQGVSGAHVINLDKQSNIYTKMFVAPVKTYQYYLANIISNIIYLLLQVVISIAGLKYLVKIEIGMTYMQLFVIMTILVLIAVALGNLCISLGKNTSESTYISNIIIMFFLMTGGCFVPAQMLPEFMSKLSYFTPVTWAMISINDLQQGLPFVSITKNLFIMILFAVMFFVITAYKTSRSEKQFNILG